MHQSLLINDLKKEKKSFIQPFEKSYKRQATEYLGTEFEEITQTWQTVGSDG